MSTEKEFEGKTLDEAIASALTFFGVEREKLEIEILNDAQGGIFGLMGAKKAKIRAAKVELSVQELLQTSDTAEHHPSPAEKKPGSRKPRQEPRPQTARGAETGTPAEPEAAPSAGRQEHPAESGTPAKADSRSESRPEARSDTRPDARADSRPDSRREARPKPAPRRRPDEAPAAPRRRPDPAAVAEAREDLPDINPAAMDQAKVIGVVSEMVGSLVQPIAGEVPLSVSVSEGRVGVVLDCGDASGLLVGRDGQTLAAIQYLAARMTAKALGGNFRLVIDAGNYRERQEDKLRELALDLADKVRKTGRSQSTRPLSAYQRRIIHLALENHPEVATCSKGDGLQRRVVVQPRRSRPDKPVDAPQAEAGAREPDSGSAEE